MSNNTNLNNVDEYIDTLHIPPTNQASSQPANNTNYGDALYGLKGAFNFANACRDKEIDRFWSRGLYFWGFIVASFGAYIAVLKIFITDNTHHSGIYSVLQDIYSSPTSLFILSVISFICFIFCLSWTLVNKGSKYWQENWETHVRILEKKLIGDIYATSLDSKEKHNDTNACVFSNKSFDYSVSKI